MIEDMNKQKVTFSEQEAYGAARQYFIQNCGIQFNNDKHHRMYKEGLEVRECGFHGIHINAIISKFGPEVFHDHGIHIGDRDISCEAFSQIPDDNVTSVYLYMITGGECVCSKEDTIMRQLFADIWGTSYVDSGRDMLEGVIKRDAEQDVLSSSQQTGYLSPSYGPGFYGMEMPENKKIAEILESDRIGVEVRDSGIMVPLKSCSGIYLVVKDPAGLPLKACQTCRGNAKGCEQCRMRSPKK